MFPGTILLPAGLLITGWTARPDIHWIVPDIGIVIVGAGMIPNFQAIQMYVIDAFTLHAASGMRSVLPYMCPKNPMQFPLSSSCGGNVLPISGGVRVPPVCPRDVRHSTIWKRRYDFSMRCHCHWRSVVRIT